MSDETQATGTVGETGTAKASIPIVPLMMAVMVAVLAAVGGLGGAAFWAIKSGRISFGGTKVEAAVVADPIKTKLVALDPMLVNLADPDGHAYLRVGLTLKLEDPPPAKGEKPKEEKAEKGAPKNEFDAAERDAAFGILGKETAADLLAADGKERLKKDLEAELKVRVPEVKVVDVLITEFLVQR